jgi:hypothetical protein
MLQASRPVGLRTRATAIGLAVIAVAATGCVRVHAHQREHLAAPAMRAPVWPAVTTGDEHMFAVREGTAGASGEGGGGCGCN